MDVFGCKLEKTDSNFEYIDNQILCPLTSGHIILQIVSKMKTISLHNNWSALATAPTSASAGAKEASIFAKLSPRPS